MRIYKHFCVIIFCSILLLGNHLTIQGQAISNSAASGTDMTEQSGNSSDINVDEATLKSYVGRYNYGQGAVLVVTLDGKQLSAQMTGQPKFPIFPASKDEFNWKVLEAKVKFVTDEKGNVTHVIHNQNGQRIEAKKLKDETPITVNPAIFDKYVGKYDFGNNNIIDVTKDGDRLMAQGPNLPKYQLLAASEIEYFLQEVNVRLTFRVNTEGKTDGIALHVDGMEMMANRVKE